MLWKVGDRSDARRRDDSRIAVLRLQMEVEKLALPSSICNRESAIERRGTDIMRLDTTINQRMVQQMHLAPRMIQSMEILQLPIMALQERIQQELQENPVLELKDSSDEPAADADGLELEAPVADDGRDPGDGELIIDDTGGNEIDFDRLEALSRDWGDVLNEEHRPSRGGMDEEGDKKHDAMQNMASRPQSLQEYLSEQLSFLELRPEQADLARYLITHVDDNGFLTLPDESDPEYQKMKQDPDYKPARPL